MDNKPIEYRGKVLYILGGIPHYTAPLLDKIVSKGYRVTMLIPQQKDKNVIGEGVKLVNSTSSYDIRYCSIKNAWYGKSAILDLNKILLEEKPDILINGWPYFLQLYFERSILKTIIKLGIKLVIREIPFQVPPYRDFKYFNNNPIYNENLELQSKGLLFFVRSAMTMIIRKFIYSKADATLNYASDAKRILPSYGIDSKRIFIGYNTADSDSLLDQFKKLSHESSTRKTIFRILHLGRLVKWKRVDDLIEAFNIVLKKYENAELVIIGNGPEKEYLQKLALNLGIQNKVFFPGALYEAETLGKYMFESSVYVLAGMGGLSINEAMCFALPVICSKCDGTEKDLVVDGVNGYFFEEGNIGNLASKIELIIENPVQAENMGKNSLDIITQKINLDTVSDRYVNAFDLILNKTKNSLFF